MKYTAEDVKNAVAASAYDAEAQTEECSVYSLVASMFDVELNPNAVKAEMAAYKRGKAVLVEAKLLQAKDRTTTPVLSNSEFYAEFVGADSPTVLLEAGWIATSQAYRAYALKATS